MNKATKSVPKFEIGRKTCIFSNKDAAKKKKTKSLKSPILINRIGMKQCFLLTCGQRRDTDMLCVFKLKT